MNIKKYILLIPSVFFLSESCKGLLGDADKDIAEKLNLKRRAGIALTGRFSEPRLPQEIAEWHRNAIEDIVFHHPAVRNMRVEKDFQIENEELEVHLERAEREKKKVEALFDRDLEVLRDRLEELSVRYKETSDKNEGLRKSMDDAFQRALVLTRASSYYQKEIRFHTQVSQNQLAMRSTNLQESERPDTSFLEKVLSEYFDEICHEAIERLSYETHRSPKSQGWDTQLEEAIKKVWADRGAREENEEAEGYVSISDGGSRTVFVGNDRNEEISEIQNVFNFISNFITEDQGWKDVKKAASELSPIRIAQIRAEYFKNNFERLKKSAKEFSLKLYVENQNAVNETYEKERTLLETNFEVKRKIREEKLQPLNEVISAIYRRHHELSKPYEEGVAAIRRIMELDSVLEEGIMALLVE